MSIWHCTHILHDLLIFVPAPPAFGAQSRSNPPTSSVLSKVTAETKQISGASGFQQKGKKEKTFEATQKREMTTDLLWFHFGLSSLQTSNRQQFLSGRRSVMHCLKVMQVLVWQHYAVRPATFTIRFDTLLKNLGPSPFSICNTHCTSTHPKKKESQLCVSVWGFFFCPFFCLSLYYFPDLRV